MSYCRDFLENEKNHGYNRYNPKPDFKNILKKYETLPVYVNGELQEKKVLDVCCGPKGMWFNKHDERTLYLDKRRETHIDTYPCGTKTNIINPDIIGDFTDIKQPDNTFWHVVFDPPHIERPETNNGQLGKKYGLLNGDWREMIRKGFKECFRVLRPNGTLIFKWNEVEFPVKDIIKLAEHKPLYGHKSGKKMQTHWICFIKPNGFEKTEAGGQKTLRTVEQHEPQLNEPEQACFISHVSNPVCPSCGTDDIIYRFKTNSFICHKCVDVEWANGC